MKPLTLITTPTRNRRLNELVGLLLLLAASLLMLALVSYHPSDKSLDTVSTVASSAAGAHAVKNWTGPAGAALSDLLLQVEGVTAFTLPLLVGLLGWAWISSRARSQTAANPWIKVGGIALILVSAPLLFALLPWRWLLFGAIQPGGPLWHPVAGLARPAIESTRHVPAGIVHRGCRAVSAHVIHIQLGADLAGGAPCLPGAPARSAQ